MLFSITVRRRVFRCGSWPRQIGPSVFLAAILAVAACSNEPARNTADVHSAPEWLPDRRTSPASIIATHTYTCDSNRVIAIQYLGDGLSLLLHRPDKAQPDRLRAAKQGGAFIGSQIALKLHGQSVTFREANRVRRCQRD